MSDDKQLSGPRCKPGLAYISDADNLIRLVCGCKGDVFKLLGKIVTISKVVYESPQVNSPGHTSVGSPRWMWHLEEPVSVSHSCRGFGQFTGTMSDLSDQTLTNIDGGVTPEEVRELYLTDPVATEGAEKYFILPIAPKEKVSS